MRTKPGPLGTALFGAAIGTLVGVRSIGAGSLLMAGFTLFYGALPAQRAVGVDVVHGAVLAVVATLVHGTVGRIDMPMVGSLVMGSLPGIVLGSWLCSRLPSHPLCVVIVARLAFSGVCLL